MVGAIFSDGVDELRFHVASVIKGSDYGTTRLRSGDDILNIDGFSDAVFQVVVALYLTGDEGRFVTEVEAVAL